MEVREFIDERWSLQTDSTTTSVCTAASHFCPFTMPSGKGQDGRRNKCSPRDRRRLQLKLPVEPLPSTTPSLAHDVASRRCSER